MNNNYCLTTKSKNFVKLLRKILENDMNAEIRIIYKTIDKTYIKMLDLTQDVLPRISEQVFYDLPIDLLMSTKDYVKVDYRVGDVESPFPSILRKDTILAVNIGSYLKLKKADSQLYIPVVIDYITYCFSYHVSVKEASNILNQIIGPNHLTDEEKVKLSVIFASILEDEVIEHAIDKLIDKDKLKLSLKETNPSVYDKTIRNLLDKLESVVL